MITLHFNFQILHVILCTGLMQSALAALDSQVIRGHPCVKRNKQIYCPLPGSTDTKYVLLSCVMLPEEAC